MARLPRWRLLECVGKRDHLPIASRYPVGPAREAIRLWDSLTKDGQKTSLGEFGHSHRQIALVAKACLPNIFFQRFRYVHETVPCPVRRGLRGARAVEKDFLILKWIYGMYCILVKTYSLPKDTKNKLQFCILCSKGFDGKAKRPWLIHPAVPFGLRP